MIRRHLILLLAVAAAGCAAPQYTQAPRAASSVGDDADGAHQVASPSVRGLGFVVSRQGHVLTSHRLIARCAAPRIEVGGSPAIPTLVANRPDEDLALLRIEAAPRGVAVFRAGRCLRVGDDVVVPRPVVSGTSGALTLADGTVTSLSGPHGEHDRLRVLASEPTNSVGGPVMDNSGRVVGLVTHNSFAAKTSSSEWVAARESALLPLLDAYGVQYQMSSAADERDSDRLLAGARAFVVTVECGTGSASVGHMPGDPRESRPR